MRNALIVQQPASQARQLMLLYHGVGASPEDLRPLGEALTPHFPRAWIISVRAPHLSESGSGWQWFSVRGVDEANRPARVAQAMPGFIQTVRQWQRELGTEPAATTLIGFSQGAIMSLEATQEAVPLAARVVAIAGRFAQPPRVAPTQTALHLLHGQQDPVVPSVHSEDAAERLRALGAQVTLDVFPGLGHGVDERLIRRMVERLQESAGPERRDAAG